MKRTSRRERPREGEPNGTSPAEESPDEFDRFRDLTRRLLKVPKKELDAEVKRQEQERSRARRANGRGRPTT